MGLVVFDGYDHYLNGNDFTNRSGVLQYSNTGVTFQTGRFGYGKAVSGAIRASLSSGFSEFYWGSALNIGDTDTISFVDNQVGGGGNQFSVVFDGSNGQIGVFNGAGTLIGSSATNVFSVNTWSHWQIHGLIAPSSGGSVTIVRDTSDTVLTLSGITTQHTTNATINGWNSGGLGANAIVDDTYFLDTTVGGGLYPCNGFIGDLRVDTLFPVGDDAVQWTRLSGATNASMVNETAMDSDTTYNFSATPGQEDRLNFQSLVNTINAVVGLQVTGAYRKDDANVRTLKQLLKSGATEVYGATNTLPSTYAYFTDIFPLDPNTGLSWTVAAINALKAGYNLVS